MSLSVLTNPPGVAFARNPIPMTLLSYNGTVDTVYGPKPATAILKFAPTLRLADGEMITVAWTEPANTSESVAFTASNLNTTETNLPSTTFTGDNLQYWELVAEKIRVFYYLAPHISVTRKTMGAETWLVFQAKETLPGWVLNISTSNTSVTIDTFPPTPDNTPTNYRVQLEMFFEKEIYTGKYEKLATLEQRPNALGHTTFDLSGLLERQCSDARSEPLVPVWAVTQPLFAQNLRQYYVRYTEIFGEPATAAQWGATPPLKAMDGGVSMDQYALGLTLSRFSATNAFASWQPDFKKVSKGQPEFLCWFNHTGTSAKVKLNRQLFSNIDGQGLINQSFYEIPVRPWETLIFPLRNLLDGSQFPVNAPEADVNKVVFRVCDFDTSDPLSEARTYILDRTPFESIRYIQYINGFGAPETLRCTGNITKKLRVQRTTGVRPYQPGTQYATDTFPVSVAWEPILEYRTGFITRAEAEALQDFLISKYIYDVSAEGYIPLAMQPDTFAVTETAQDLHSYTFQCALRLDLRNYSHRPAITANAPDAWETPDGAKWTNAFTQPWTLP